MMEDIALLLQEEITLDILIYGSTMANYSTNSSIFKIVQSFISKTKRFWLSIHYLPEHLLCCLCFVKGCLSRMHSDLLPLSIVWKLNFKIDNARNNFNTNIPYLFIIWCLNHTDPMPTVIILNSTAAHTHTPPLSLYIFISLSPYLSNPYLYQSTFFK